MTNDNEAIPWRMACPDFHPGRCLVGLRCREGMTQVDMAKQLNMSVKQLRLLEHGDLPIPQELARKLAKMFDISEHCFK